jgi:trimethylamine-N-oxide reductase (cytochrome c)
MYEPLWIHPQTAVGRGIQSGDIVKAYNQRGAVLCGAIVWERIMPGVVYVDHGARVDWIIPGELDRGGYNLISPIGCFRIYQASYQQLSGRGGKLPALQMEE